MNYAIVDDEPIAHHIIEEYAARVPFLVRVGGCYHAFEALDLLHREHIDLLFLDVQLPKLSGFELLRTLIRPPLVIAVSAHAGYAVEGFDLSVCDYLLKPFSFERFLRAVNKAQLAARIDPTAAAAEETTVFFKDGKKHRQVNVDRLGWIEAHGNFAMVHLVDGRFLTQERLSELAERLPQILVRVHKSYVIPIRRITTVAGDTVATELREFPVGRVYKGNLRALLGK